MENNPFNNPQPPEAHHGMPQDPPQPTAPDPAPAWNQPPAAPAAPEPVSWSAPAPQAPTPPPAAPAAPSYSNDINPLAVVQVLSTRGVEYTMLTLCLWLAALAVLWVLLALVNGGMHFSVIAFPIALLVVNLPVFSWLFLRLKKAELANPALKLDPSKRRLTQFTQVIAFAACLFNVIAFVYLIFAQLAGQGGPALWKDFLNLLVVLLVAGGVLVYYWNDEHRGN
jgi:hypothetical protein